jgi:hypothetical protein
MSASNTQATAASVPTTLPSPFHTFPHTPSVEVKPFTVDFPQADIDDLQRRIADAPRRRRTYENSTTDEQLGVTREWLENALETWKAFDWYVAALTLANSGLDPVPDLGSPQAPDRGHPQ